MREMLEHILQQIIDILFPKEADVRTIETLIQRGALNSLPKAPSLPKEWMYALFHYKHKLVRTLVWHIKFKGNGVFVRAVAISISEEILSYFEEKGLFSSKEWLLVPIPATAIHKKEKGFNQTELVAEKIMETDAQNFVTYTPDALIKYKNTLPQVAIRNRSERMRNLIGAYKVTKPELIFGKNIILIDDVITTGSTLVEARRALRDAGARQVVAFAVAH